MRSLDRTRGHGAGAALGTEAKSGGELVKVAAYGLVGTFLLALASVVSSRFNARVLQQNSKKMDDIKGGVDGKMEALMESLRATARLTEAVARAAGVEEGYIAGLKQGREEGMAVADAQAAGQAHGLELTSRRPVPTEVKK
jgi:hypothetical protein